MRLRHYTAVALNLLLFLQSAVLRGQEKRPAAAKTEVSWSELGGLVTGQKIGLALAGDKKIEGKVLAVEPDRLLLDVTKTSDRKAYPKGRTSILRVAVPELRLLKSGRAGRIVLTTLGILGGMTVGSLVGWKAGGDGAAGAVLGGMALGGAGLGAAGYFAGRSADRKVTVITVIPESAESTSTSVVGGATERTPTGQLDKVDPSLQSAGW